jgi:1-deoxy-D-xylulose-5-phosphate synthase
MKSRVERALLPSSFWQQLGFTYLGPVDGHNITELEAALTRARDYEDKPTLVHVLTRKGKGYSLAETNPTKFHGVSPKTSVKNDAPSYSQVFGKTVVRLLRENKRVVAITAAMLDGTALSEAEAEFPKRVFDVGICEQHAVTLAAGLATQGFIPIVAIYSTFLQRAYDQIIHDVCLQNLPVVFAIDRAGIVGDDGKTHQGAFDISYLRAIPNIVVAAPRDEDELQQLIYTAVQAKRPMAVRYPRGPGEGINLNPRLAEIPIGKGELLQGGEDIAIIALGSSVYPALDASARLLNEGVSCAVIDARFAKPLDEELILSLTGRMPLVTVEENVLAGGFGSAVAEMVNKSNQTAIKIESLGLPDQFIEHGTQQILRSLYNLDSDGIFQNIKSHFPELFTVPSIRGKVRNK